MFLFCHNRHSRAHAYTHVFYLKRTSTRLIVNNNTRLIVNNNKKKQPKTFCTIVNKTIFTIRIFVLIVHLLAYESDSLFTRADQKREPFIFKKIRNCIYPNLNVCTITYISYANFLQNHKTGSKICYI